MLKVNPECLEWDEKKTEREKDERDDQHVILFFL